jgi:hypothetical protein
MSNKPQRDTRLNLRKTILYISLGTAFILLLILLIKEITKQREVVPLQTPLPSETSQEAAP